MTWTDLTTNVSTYIDKLKVRFPYVDADTLEGVTHPNDVVDHVAQSHDLTSLEAQQELDDWLFVESLARQASELRAR